MQTRYLYILRLVLVFSDLILLNGCLFLGFYLSSKYGHAMDTAIYKNNFVTCNIIWLLTSSSYGLYSEETIYKLEYIYRSTWKSIVLHGFFFLAYLFFTEIILIHPLILHPTFYPLLGAWVS